MRRSFYCTILAAMTATGAAAGVVDTVHVNPQPEETETPSAIVEEAPGANINGDDLYGQIGEALSTIDEDAAPVLSITSSAGAGPSAGAYEEETPNQALSDNNTQAFPFNIFSTIRAKLHRHRRESSNAPAPAADPADSGHQQEAWVIEEMNSDSVLDSEEKNEAPVISVTPPAGGTAQPETPAGAGKSGGTAQPETPAGAGKAGGTAQLETPAGAGKAGDTAQLETPAGAGKAGGTAQPETPAGAGKAGDTAQPETPAEAGKSGDTAQPETPAEAGKSGDTAQPETPAGAGKSGDTAQPEIPAGAGKAEDKAPAGTPVEPDGGQESEKEPAGDNTTNLPFTIAAARANLRNKQKEVNGNRPQEPAVNLNHGQKTEVTEDANIGTPEQKEIVDEFLGEHPTFSKWDCGDTYFGFAGCTSFARILQDKVYGVYGSDKPGSVKVINNPYEVQQYDVVSVDGGGHDVFVLRVIPEEDLIEVAQGNVGGKVYNYGTEPITNICQIYRHVDE